MYRSFVVREQDNGEFSRSVEEKDTQELPAGEVLVRVHYSSLNYKDALSASGNRGVTRRYPHTPGIDAAGVVEDSTVSVFQPGDQVIVSGYDLGMNHPGGFAEYVRVPAAWVVRLPQGLSLEQSMMLGTAGFTAGRCVEMLVCQGCVPGEGDILVTGATGGVGSISVAILARLGFAVTALTGKNEPAFLLDLGARTVLARGEFVRSRKKMLLPERWAGVIDTVGGQYLETAIKETRYDGVVTSCGNAASGDLALTVYPFIIRGVRLIGIDSARCPLAVRERIWQQLATEYKFSQLDHLISVITLEELDEAIQRMLAGSLRGRMLVRLI
ncbi:MAG: YhdH/YhfP family quinone oxidoreductase [Deltaproteobacteria bacterium]|nr:YhdH/YhfP family quinone oxidoreductase [Deltaproteobacteria bacterium]